MYILGTYQKEEEHIAAIMMNDYRTIYNNKGYLLTPSQSNILHEDHKTWLFNVFDNIYCQTKQIMKDDQHLQENLCSLEYQYIKTIVITHHAPSVRLDTLKHVPCCYTGNYEHLIGNYIYTWVSGHTHQNHRLQTPEGTLLISNCIGYKNQKTGFDLKFIVNTK